jgi:hypothetical protein
VERGRKLGRAVGAVAVVIHGKGRCDRVDTVCNDGALHKGLDLKLARNTLAALSGVSTSPFTMAVTLR